MSSKTLDEEFEDWRAEDGYHIACEFSGHAHHYARAAFLAGAAAEREAALLIVEDVKTDHWPRESSRGDGYDLDTCDEIIKRIRQREGEHNEKG